MYIHGPTKFEGQTCVVKRN